MNIMGLGALYEDIGEYSQALNCYSDAISGAQSLENQSLFAETINTNGCLEAAYRPVWTKPEKSPGQLTT